MKIQNLLNIDLDDLDKNESTEFIASINPDF
jgi:hypothetical protein